MPEYAWLFRDTKSLREIEDDANPEVTSKSFNYFVLNLNFKFLLKINKVFTFHNEIQGDRKKNCFKKKAFHVTKCSYRKH